jgi:DNA mismatch endonuclease (patch repair protein)
MGSDVFTKAKRSEVMSRIRGRGNRTTELALMNLFRRQRITGWRRHQPVFGKPDFVFRRQKVAVFVDGCFWHGCPRCYRRPKSNQEFWDAKVVRNRDRDRRVNRELRKLGWRVTRIWGHSLAFPESIAARINYMLRTASKRCNTAVRK